MTSAVIAEGASGTGFITSRRVLTAGSRSCSAPEAPVTCVAPAARTGRPRPRPPADEVMKPVLAPACGMDGLQARPSPGEERGIQKAHQRGDRPEHSQQLGVKAIRGGEFRLEPAAGKKLFEPEVPCRRVIREIPPRHAGKLCAVQLPDGSAKRGPGDDTMQRPVMGPQCARGSDANRRRRACTTHHRSRLLRAPPAHRVPHLRREKNLSRGNAPPHGS